MNRKSAFGLVEILVVIVIIAILALILIPRVTGGKDPVTGKNQASPINRARAVAGNAYISQINSAITMYKMDNDNKNPTSLAELKRYGVNDEMMIDPITKQPLAYNPETGQVGAPTNAAAPGGTQTNLPNVGALPGGITP